MRQACSLGFGANSRLPSPLSRQLGVIMPFPASSSASSSSNGSVAFARMGAPSEVETANEGVNLEIIAGMHGSGTAESEPREKRFDGMPPSKVEKARRVCPETMVGWHH